MKNKIIIKPKGKIHTLRDWLARRFVGLANWIRPGNEAALAYFMGIIQEATLEEMLYGKSEIEIKLKKQKRKKWKLKI